MVQERRPRPSTFEDFALAEEGAAALAEWAGKYLQGARLNASGRNNLKYLIMTASTGEPVPIRFGVELSEDLGSVYIRPQLGA